MTARDIGRVNRAKQAYRCLKERLHREPTITEIAAHLEWNKDELYALLHALTARLLRLTSTTNAYPPTRRTHS
jgi:DNA-directed RNA polymerase specialized sigma subunit